MGSSGKGTGAKSIDTSAGALVWVQRRNNSWWPAQVVGSEELPKDCVINGKSGIPVKLLGRDDATVEWHNVEKSKRVKAFRCGEFDGCIQKAKKAAASGTKRVFRYARREDAILCALDIENASLEKDALEFCSSDGDKKDEEVQDCEKTHASLHAQEDAEESPELSHSGVTFEEKTQVSSAKGKQLRNPNDSEEDGTGGIKRMRGLIDLGVGAVVSYKRKRTPVAFVHEYLKKKSRRKTITKVLETTVSVPEQPGSPTTASDDKVSGLATNGLKGSSLSEKSTLGKCTQKKNKHSRCENGSSDHLFDVPLLGEEKQPAAPTSQADAGPLSSPSSQVENVPLGNGELIESASASSGADDVNNLNYMLEKGPSKWRLKGKRKPRHSNRSKLQDKGANPHLRALEQNVLSLRSGRKVDYNSSGGAHPPKPRTVADAPQDQNRSLPFRMSRFVLNPKYNSADFSLRHHLTDNTLYNVNLEVKGSYRPQHVPYISLMSKLNGLPIVGHPLTVEPVEDGFTDQFFSSSDVEDDDPKDSFVLQRFDMVYERRSGKLTKSRKNAALSKKTRRLSTLTTHKKGGGSSSHSFGKKPVIEDLKGHAIACVPVKLVFSRINADLKG